MQSKYSYPEYTQCLECDKECFFSEKVFFSKNCLHPLCDNCFIKCSQLKQMKCKRCKQLWTITDVLKKPKNKDYFERDLQLRHELFKKFYKRRENFSNENEYNSYLERVEEMLFQKINKDNLDNFIDNFDGENKKEIENNRIKFIETVNLLNKKALDNDPNKLYNPFCNDIDNNNLMDIEYDQENRPNNNNIKILNEDFVRMPEYVENLQIKIIKSKDKEILAGGYDEKAVYKSYSSYAKAGLFL